MTHATIAVYTYAMSDLTKEYLDLVITDLKTFIKEENENMAQIVAKGFEDLEKRFDVVERVERLEKEFAQLKQALRV